ncbi:MAG: hypothetical protein NDI61_10815, partial [Bdellovibrionaceae bacterium]|nr:hypothetical protein [Pseudobdellovibrionaceae bacterium]
MESPTTLLPFVGRVNFPTGTYTVVSSQLDLQHSSPDLVSFVADATIPAGSAVTLEVASADAPFSIADASWVSAASIANASGGRYVRLRLTVSHQDAENPVLVRSMTLNYTLTDQTRFEFSGCGWFRSGQVPRPPPPWVLVWLLVLIVLPILVLTSLRRT